MKSIDLVSVSKSYKIYKKPSDRLFESVFRAQRHTLVESLSDITFSVNKGDSLGIVGSNGAGKSTLLKILTGIISPTSGEVCVSGRVAALLELGAGFHPEFTGRQNIHLNAALLGLSEDEIRERESSIIEFSELGDFIDRPVKIYSSGMYVRLGFSIATSVSPDVLIIDEALSVGDLHFQKKCVDRILEFRKAGVTILFCSHNLYQVQELCSFAVWLDKGRLMEFGTSKEVTNNYMNYLDNVGANGKIPEKISDDVGDYECKGRVLSISSIKFNDSVIEQECTISPLESISLEIDVRSHVSEQVFGHIGVQLLRPDGEIVFTISTKEEGLEAKSFGEKESVTVKLKSIPLNYGRYRLKVIVADENAMVLLDESFAGEVIIKSERPEFGSIRVQSVWADWPDCL